MIPETALLPPGCAQHTEGAVAGAEHEGHGALNK